MSDTVARYFTTSEQHARRLTAECALLIQRTINQAAELGSLGYQLKDNIAVGEAVLVLLAYKLDPRQIVALVGYTRFTERDVEIIAARAIALEFAINLTEIKRCN